MEQIIKFGISNYLQLCVEAGFSQIQSQLCMLVLFTSVICEKTWLPCTIRNAEFNYLFHSISGSKPIPTTPRVGTLCMISTVPV